MRWHHWLSGAACVAGLAWASGCATGSSTDEEGSGGTLKDTSCKVDADCASGLCKPVVVGADPVCVTPCKTQEDCGSDKTHFCEPSKADSADGLCIPRSPAHCLACEKNSDCGSLSEVCFQPTGDVAKACHIDCSLSGDAACPEDYACSDQKVEGKARKLCRPKSASSCVDAQGGFCDTHPEPLPCARTTAEVGTCTGERVCSPETKRFGKCSAAVPKCKADCSAKEVAGCMTNFCAGVATKPDNCGTCGTVCPGYMQPNDNVACQGGMACTLSCQGEHYDVDHDPSNGCEATDPTVGNHADSSAVSLTSMSCYDDDTFSISEEHIISDQRAHETPDVSAFDTTTGSAPDWFSIHMDGGDLCQNNVVVKLQVNGTAFPACYRLDLDFRPSGAHHECKTTNGSCSINKTSTGNYADGDVLYLHVSKTCEAAQAEDVTYSVTGFF
jgi:hypothetical protein